MSLPSPMFNPACAKLGVRHRAAAKREIGIRAERDIGPRPGEQRDLVIRKMYAVRHDRSFAEESGSRVDAGIRWVFRKELIRTHSTSSRFSLR